MAHLPLPPISDIKVSQMNLGLIAEFQQFLAKTNAVALAIGVIIGGTTTKLISGFVQDLFDPIVGALLANVDLEDLKIVLGTTKNAQGQMVENAMRIGDFIAQIINFVVVMAVVFVLARLVARKLLEGDVIDTKKVKDKAIAATKD